MSFLWYGGFLLVAAASFLFSYHELMDGGHHPTVEVHRVAASAAVGQTQSDPKISPTQQTREWGPPVVVGTAQAHETPAIGPAEIARKNAQASTSKRADAKRRSARIARNSARMNAGSPNSGASNIRAGNTHAMSIPAHWDTRPSADFSVGGDAQDWPVIKSNCDVPSSCPTLENAPQSLSNVIARARCAGQRQANH